MNSIWGVLLTAAVGLIAVVLVILGVLRWAADGAILVSLGIALLVIHWAIRNLLYGRMAQDLRRQAAGTKSSETAAELVYKLAGTSVAVISICAAVAGVIFDLQWLIIAGVVGLVAAAVTYFFAATFARGSGTHSPHSESGGPPSGTPGSG